jgi:hypothetical protein
MAKRWTLLLLAVALGLAVVPLAAAGNGGGGDKGKDKLKFELVGTVSPVNAVISETSETTLTVNVKAGSKSVKWARGHDLLLVVRSDTRVRIVTAEGCKTATLAQVRALVGARVKVRGRVNGPKSAPVYVALDIKARAAKPSPPPSPSPGE